MNSLFIRSLRAHGFSLIELLVVIAIIGLLSSMLMAALGTSEEIAVGLYDGNNMQNIHKMMLTERVSTRQTWAFPRGNSNFSLPSMQQPQINNANSNASGIDVTNISLFTLAARTELSPDIFNSPLYDPKFTHIANFEKNDESTWTTAQIAGWASPETNDVNNTNLPYAFDWSAPKNAGTTRILLAMRDPTAYSDSVPVVYADGRTGHLSYNLENNRVVNTAVTPLNPDGSGKNGITPDDIYNDTGDFGDTNDKNRHLWFARGHSTKTSLK